jgi:hypothetical protein
MSFRKSVAIALVVSAFDVLPASAGVLYDNGANTGSGGA